MNLKTMRFEPLDEGKIPAILEIERVSNPSPWSERSFRNELDNPQSVFRTVHVDGKLVGYGGLWTVVDEAHITTVAIAPEARQHGLGKRLMNELLGEAKGRGMASATLEVRASNAAARALYERLGFEEAAVRKGYYPDNREDAIVMWLYNLGDWTPKRA